MRPCAGVHLFLAAALLAVLCSAPLLYAGENTADGFEFREVRLSYLKPGPDALGTITAALGPGGSAAYVQERGSVMLYGTPATLDRASKLLAQMDTRPPQVMIEASIVEVDSSQSSALGINWGANYDYASGDVFGRLGNMNGEVGVNFPMLGEGANGLGLGFGMVNDRVALNLKLSALEENGGAEIKSNPRIRVLDGHTATITDGVELLVSSSASTVINAGLNGSKPDISVFSAALRLDVVPHISRDGQIALDVEVRREEFDYSREFGGYPQKITKSASTDLLIPDGATVAIGGINVTNSAKKESGVPLLSKIPILGWLFKGKSDASLNRELMIFLTPTTIPEDAHDPS